MIAVIDLQYRLLENLSKAVNDSSMYLSYHIGDKILHEHEGKEYKYVIRDIIHKTGKDLNKGKLGAKPSTVIVVERVKSIWKKP